jgi:hypothetical protein
MVDVVDHDDREGATPCARLRVAAATGAGVAASGGEGGSGQQAHGEGRNEATLQDSARGVLEVLVHDGFSLLLAAGEGIRHIGSPADWPFQSRGFASPGRPGFALIDASSTLNRGWRRAMEFPTTLP